MDEFEDGFNAVNDAALAAEKSETVEQKAPANEPAAPAPAPAATDKPEDQEVKDEQVTSPAPAPAPANDDEDPAKLRQKLATVQGILAKQGDELKQLRDAQKAASAAPPPPAPAPAPAEDEDAELLAELEESSPVLAKAIKAAMKRERTNLEQVLADKYGKSIDEVKQQLQPLKQSADENEVQKHNSAITSAHPDAFTLVESQEFSTWLEAQDEVAKEAYQGVLKQGTARQVIGMLNSFKKSTTAPTPPNPEQGKDPAAARREQQMKSVAGIPTRGAPASAHGSSKNDFDAGFDAAAAQTQ